MCKRTKFTALMLAITLISILFGGNSFVTAAGTNIAPDATLSVDSTYDGTYTKDKAVDGIKDTISSRWLSEDTAVDHWIQLDWASSKLIDNVKIWSGQPNEAGHHIESYQIEYWDGNSWVVAVSIIGNTEDCANGDYNDLTFEAVVTTKLRMFITDPDVGGSNIARLAEIEVYEKEFTTEMVFVDLADVSDTYGAIRVEPKTVSEISGLSTPENECMVIGVFDIGGGTYEVFVNGIIINKEWNYINKLYRYTTTDFISYSTPTEVLDMGTGFTWQLYSTMARDNSGNYLLVKFAWESGYGLRAHTFTSSNGTSWSKTQAGYNWQDHDSGSLYWDDKNSQWIYFQITTESYIKKYSDNIGNYRRILGYRTSSDGINWSNVGSTVTPDEEDNEIEFYNVLGFDYGDKYIGYEYTYVPSPLIPGEHGIITGLHWWVSDDISDITKWKRPFKVQEICDGLYFNIKHQPCIYNGDYIWMWIDGKVYGLEEYRVAGIYSEQNGEFTTKPFRMPSNALNLNAEVTHDIPDYLSRQGYIMVEVLDANGNTIAGYEASKCLIEDQDGSNIALLWNGSNTTSLAGQIVQLKFYFMDANIYSVGE